MYLLLKAKYSDTGIKRESVLYTTSNSRGFALIKSYLKDLLRYTLTGEFQVTGKKGFLSHKQLQSAGS